MQGSTGFRILKSAQVAAQFIRRAGGRIDAGSLTTLMFLAERENIVSRGMPMIYDQMESTPDGPACRHIRQAVASGGDAVWRKIVADGTASERCLAREMTRDDEDRLSRADHKVIDHVWSEFGHLSDACLREWMIKTWPCQIVLDGDERIIPDDEIARMFAIEDVEEYCGRVAEYRAIAASFPESYDDG